MREKREEGPEGYPFNVPVLVDPFLHTAIVLSSIRPPPKKILFQCRTRRISDMPGGKLSTIERDLPFLIPWPFQETTSIPNLALDTTASAVGEYLSCTQVTVDLAFSEGCNFFFVPSAALSLSPGPDP